MKQKLLKIVSIMTVLAGMIFMTGCASNLNSDVAPGVDLSEIKSVYVQKLPADNRGVDQIIANQLNAMGILAEFGEEAPDSGYDAVITYQDKWMWDITMYMIELQVQIKKPSTGFVLASGNSYRTSLVRKSPEEMVKEVLTEIFKK